MTNENKSIKQKYLDGDIISVCLVSHEDYSNGKRKTIEHKVGDKWISIKPTIKNYMNYSDGICESHIKNLYSKVYAKMIASRTEKANVGGEE